MKTDLLEIDPTTREIPSHSHHHTQHSHPEALVPCTLFEKAQVRKKTN